MYNKSEKIVSKFVCRIEFDNQTVTQYVNSTFHSLNILYRLYRLFIIILYIVKYLYILHYKSKPRGSDSY